MIDTSTKRKLTVLTGAKISPYITVPVAQIAAVRLLLDSQKVPYFVDDIAVSLDDGPEVTVFNLGREANPHVVQKLLDSLS